MAGMQVVVNGESRDMPPQSTISQLLEQLRVVPERVVVELNLKILKRAEHPATVLQDGDRVEIVQFVGGGSGVPTCRRADVRTYARMHICTPARKRGRF